MPFLSDHAANGSGRPAGTVVEQPTITIPCGCLCSWSVVRPALGIECISRQTYASALCPAQRDHDKHRRPVAAVPHPA